MTWLTLLDGEVHCVCPMSHMTFNIYATIFVTLIYHGLFLDEYSQLSQRPQSFISLLEVGINIEMSSSTLLSVRVWVSVLLRSRLHEMSRILISGS